MKLLIRWILLLYPTTWRQRYGEELETLLEDSGASWSGIPDLLMGALRMQVAEFDWRPVAGLSLAGLAVALIVAFSAPEQYVSHATLKLQPSSGVGQDAAMRQLIQVRGNTLSRTSLSNIIQGPPGTQLYDDERRKMPLEDVIQNMIDRDLAIELLPQPDGTVAARISYKGVSPALARAAIGTVVLQMMSYIHLRADFASDMVKTGRLDPVAAARAGGSSRVEVVEQPTLPTRTTDTSRWITLVIGLAAGVLAGIALAITRHRPKLALFGALMATFAFGVSFLVPFRYVSTAEVLFENAETAQTVLVRSGEFLKFPPELGKPGWLESVSLQPGRMPASLVIRANHPDRQHAIRLVQHVIARIIEAAPADRRGTSWRPLGAWMEVIEPPQMPISAQGVWIRSWLFLAALALAVIAAVAAFLKRFTTARVVTP